MKLRFVDCLNIGSSALSSARLDDPTDARVSFTWRGGWMLERSEVMKTAMLAIALLFSLSACGRDENYSDTKKDTSGVARDTTSTRDSAKQSPTTTSTTSTTSNGAASREGAEPGKPGVVRSAGTAETSKTKDSSPAGAASSTTAASTTSSSPEKSSPEKSSTVATATRSDKDQTSITKAQTIEGVLLKVEGDSFLVKDISGKEVKLTADSNTKKEGNLTIGDRIVARLEDRGILASIAKR
jgi:hypothetical protein